ECASSRVCGASTAFRPVAVGVGGAERGAPMSPGTYRRVCGAARRQDPLREQRVLRLRWAMRGQDPRYYVWSLRRGVGVHARHLLIGVGLRVAAGDRPGHATRDAGSGLGRLRVDLRQAVGPELGDVEEDVLAGVDPDGPRREVVLVELLAELHGFEARDPARLVERVVVVERQVVLLLLVDRDPELLRGPHHGRMAVGHEIEQLDGVDVLLVVEEELPGLLSLFSGLPWEAVEGHDVVPDADLRGLAQVVDDHGL